MIRIPGTKESSRGARVHTYIHSSRVRQGFAKGEDASARRPYHRSALLTSATLTKHWYYCCMRCAWILLGLVLGAGPVHGQQRGTPAVPPDDQLLFTARHYGVEAGLPHRTVRCLAQDQRGFIWVGTDRGLARFDGTGFQVYPMATGLSATEVARVECDRDDQLWVLYANGKLDILDSRTGQVSAFADHFAGRLPPDAPGPFTSLVASEQGTILFTGKKHLFRYRGAGRPIEAYAPGCDHFFQVVQARGDEEAWCSCNSAAELWNRADLLHITFTGPRDAPAMTVEREVDLELYRQWPDHSGWHPAQDPGNYFYRRDSTIWRPTDSAPDTAIHRFVWHDKPNACFLLPLRDDIWLVNTTIRRMRAGDDPLAAPVLFDLVETFPSASYSQHAVMRDRGGHVWVGSEFGLYKIDLQPALFRHLMPDTAGGDQAGYKIRGMVVNNGRLHVNTEQQGYWVLDAATGAVLHSQVDQLGRQGMVADGQGGIWRVEQERVLHSGPDGATDRIIHAPIGSYVPWSIVGLPDGGVLIGTIKGGLRLAEPGADSSHVCLSGNASLDRAWVWDLRDDGQARLLASTNTGLYRLNERGQVLERWWTGAAPGSPTEHFLPTDDIRYCHVAPDGIFWLATAASGLFRWNGTTGEIQVLGEREGITEASIHAILPDADGVFWMPTDNGLVRYDPSDGATKTYTTADGLPTNEFNRLAYASGPDGTFYFGGLDGIAAFRPADLRAQSAMPMAPLVLAKVAKQSAGQPNPEDLTAEVLDGAGITMQPQDRFFTVDMNLLSYGDPAQIRYAWRIEGVDADWNVQQEPHLRINSLPFRKHMLQIKAMDAQGRWTEELLTIPVTMVPPLHLRWWFILGAVFLVAFATFLVMRYRELQLRRVMALRNHIASDLHDEVGSILSSIALFSSAVGKQAGALPEKASGMLTRIKDNSTRALENMNDIVWSVNSEHDQLGDLVDRMRAYAQPLCESLDIDLKFEMDGDMASKKLDMEVRKNIYLIFKEAINNSIRHGHCTAIEVHFALVDGKPELAIADNGVGIGADAIDRLQLGGNGIGNMKRRATEIGGTLQLNDRPGGGTRVLFRS